MSITPTPAELREIERRRRQKAARREAKAARPKSPKADRGRVRDNGYLAFLRRQPCCVAGALCSGRVQAAHIRYADVDRGKPITGMQVKPADRWALPLCAWHHARQHQMNERVFWMGHGIDPLATAERLYAEFTGKTVKRSASLGGGE